MKIQAVKLFKDGFMTQTFALGGEGFDGLDPKVKYRSSLQNFVVDTGSEVILIDTGTPDDFPGLALNEDTQIYMGEKIENYLDALARVGYKPEQISKILITHKHMDHTGVLKYFPNAKIYASATESKADELKDLPNVIPVEFTDGAYYNFPKSQKIVDGIYFVEAIGHTTGNSLIVVEDGGLFYMLHGDATYTDEALYNNKFAVAVEDKAEFRKTIERIREFVSNHPTVYCSTHTPLGYENLESKKTVDLEHMPEPIPPKDIVFKTSSGKYVCSICGFVYDPAVGDPSQNIPPGTKFEDLPADWHCPRCKQGKNNFNPAA